MLRDNARVAAGVAVLVGLAGTLVYAGVVNGVYPIRLWLFWKLAAIVGWVALFNAACLSFGQLVLFRLLKVREVPPLESAVLAMTIGVVAFVLGMYAGGALALYDGAFAVLWPLLMLVAGARDAMPLLRALRADIAEPVPHGLLALLSASFGVLCVGILYLATMTPDSINYDAAWYHVSIAQDYARAGRIVAFPADYNRSVPHLASLIHTWAFIVPGLKQPALRWMLVLHGEFALFLWTLVGVAAAIRELVRDQRLRGSWVALFLFPGIFVYDNNLGGAADHVCAFFTPALLLATLRLCSTFSPSSAALVAIAAAGALLTKYQAVYLFVPLALVVAGHWAWFAARHRRPNLGPSDAPLPTWRDLVRAPAIVLGLGALLVSPHFLKNLIFYNNPVYPFMQQVFTHSTPTLPNASEYIHLIFTDATWKPKGSFAHKLGHAVGLLFTFSFKPHYSFTRDVPAFGSLFTLCLPLVPFVRERGRIAIAAALAAGALLIWGMTYNVDRNLQVFMPLMVCATAASLVQLWRLGWLARVGIVPLVAMQLVWGGDALFYSTQERIESSLALIRSGFDGRADTRLNGYRDPYLRIGQALPQDARLLLHTTHLNLGIDREIVLDWAGFQGLFNYAPLRTPRQLFEYYRSLGITHFLYEPRVRGASSKQEEVVWNALVSRHAKRVLSVGSYNLVRMPKEAPPEEPDYQVVSIGMHGYADGTYPVETMNTIEYLPAAYQKFNPPEVPLPADPQERVDTILTADAVFIGSLAKPDESLKAALDKKFVNAVKVSSVFTLYLKKDRQRPSRK